MCTYKSLVPNTRNYIQFWLSSPWTGVTDVINDLLDTFPNTVHIMLNIEPQIEKKVLHFLQENTINEMVQTISHWFNTHVKRLSLSASVVIIIITRLLATSRIITQYFNHLLLFNFTNFTTSPLKIDEPLSTFQFCHLWLRTFENWYEFLIVGSLSMCFKWYSASRRKTKALQGGKLCH